MEIKDWILNHYLPGLLVALTIIILTAIYSVIKTGNGITIYTEIPIIIWIIIAIILLIWIIIVFIRNRMNDNTFPMGFVPRGEWVNIGSEKYGGVIWRIKQPKPVYLTNIRNDTSSIQVESTPRCPNCETELDIKDKYLWYSWWCVECGFKLRTWNNNEKIKRLVEKKVERKLERENPK